MSDDGQLSGGHSTTGIGLITAAFAALCLVAIIEMAGWEKLDWPSTIAFCLFALALPLNCFMYISLSPDYGTGFDLGDLLLRWVGAVGWVLTPLGLALLLYGKSPIACVIFTVAIAWLFVVTMRVPRRTGVKR